MAENDKTQKKHLEELKRLEKRIALTNNLERKLAECLFANSYYQNALDSREAEHKKMGNPEYIPQIDWRMAMHRDSFLQDSMLFAGNRLLIWLKLYKDSYSIKSSGLEDILTFKDGIKYLRDVRTHDYNYSLARKKDETNIKVKENYKNYLIHNELGSISPNITYTFKDSNIEDQHNIGSRFRFDLFNAAVNSAYIKTKETDFFDTSDIAQKHFKLENLIRENINAT